MRHMERSQPTCVAGDGAHCIAEAMEWASSADTMTPVGRALTG